MMKKFKNIVLIVFVGLSVNVYSQLLPNDKVNFSKYEIYLKRGEDFYAERADGGNVNTIISCFNCGITTCFTIGSSLFGDDGSDTYRVISTTKNNEVKGLTIYVVKAKRTGSKENELFMFYYNSYNEIRMVDCIDEKGLILRFTD